MSHWVLSCAKLDPSWKQLKAAAAPANTETTRRKDWVVLTQIIRNPVKEQSIRHPFKRHQNAGKQRSGSAPILPSYSLAYYHPQTCEDDIPPYAAHYKPKVQRGVSCCCSGASSCSLLDDWTNQGWSSLSSSVWSP